MRRGRGKESRNQLVICVESRKTEKRNNGGVLREIQEDEGIQWGV